MGQLAVDLQKPQNRTRIRVEGGQFEYGNPTHLFEDLVATRRAWQDATILADDQIHDRVVGYIAFWEVDDPTIGFLMPMSVARVHPEVQVRELFNTRDGRSRFILLVEQEAKRLGGFDARLNPEDRPSSWVRLMEDDEFS